MDSILQDLRYALRTLAKAPGFTATAVLTLALGIGASTTVFTVAEKLILNPLPFPHGDRIVSVWRRDPVTGIGLSPSTAQALAIRSRTHSLDAVELTWGTSWYAEGAGEPEMISGMKTTPSLFRTLAIQPLAGRLLVDADTVAGASDVAVLAEQYWRRRFGGDPDVIGRVIRLDTVPYTIVGVAPARLAALDNWRPLDVVTPFRRNPDGAEVIARVRAGVSAEQAEAELEGILRQEAVGRPQTPFESRLSAEIIQVGVLGKSTMRTAILALAGAVLILLLIGCANVANLLLARASRREREIAMRRALGAGRSRLIRQLLTEGLALSLAGATLGLLFVEWLFSAFITFHPRFLYQMEHLILDGRVLGFALAVSVGTSLLFGILPAFHATGFDLHDALKGLGSHGPRVLRFQRGLVTIELALTCALLFGGGLLIRSVVAQQSTNPGFQPEGLAGVQIRLPPSRFSDTSSIDAYWRSTLERTRAVEGVQEALWVGDPIPSAGSLIGTRLEVGGVVLSHEEETAPLSLDLAPPGYFGAMGISILEGRAFTADECRLSKDVVIVNSSMARRLAPAGSALGLRIRYSARDEWRTIVGVVRDDPRTLTSFGPYATWQVRIPQPDEGEPGIPRAWIVARANPGTPAATLLPALRGVARSTDSTVIVESATTVPDLLSKHFADARFTATLLSTVAGIALVIAVVGLYGVLAYAVSQRTREIGIRIALGAERRSVIGLVVRQGLLPTGIGLAAGIFGGVVLSGFFKALLYDTPSVDPLTMGAVVILLTLTTLAATAVPARKAASVDPVTALRSE